MNVTFTPNNRCLEYRYWSNNEVTNLVDFLLHEDRFIFLRAAEILSNFSKKLSLSDIIIQIFPTLTTVQVEQYRDKLETLVTLLSALHNSASDENELGTLRTAVIEKFINKFVSSKYPSNYSHHCKVKVDGHPVDVAKDVDVAGWQSDDGEFHECKAGDFDYRSEISKVEFLKTLKVMVGDRGQVFISVFDLTDQIYIDDYKKDGINYCDRRYIAERYL